MSVSGHRGQGGCHFLWVHPICIFCLSTGDGIPHGEGEGEAGPEFKNRDRFRQQGHRRAGQADQGDRAQLDGGDDHREGGQLHQAPEGDQRVLHPAVAEGQGQHVA